MAGIYIHIPFCIKKCGYCDFYSETNLVNKHDFINTLIAEIEYRKNEINNDLIETVYIGGGTPSLLNKYDFDLFFKAIYNNYQTQNLNEITVEVNPDDINRDFLVDLKKVGFNRLSIGIQSFDDDALKLMNRRHDSVQAKRSVKLAQECGFSNISIDLIYGIPNIKFLAWSNIIDQAIDLNVQHISAYHLTFEKNTPFYKLLKSGKITNVSESDSEEQYKILLEKLQMNGFIDYEISNFCKPAYESKHNSNYWTGKKYLGFGPSAHSFNGDKRRWNNSNLKSYTLQNIESKKYFEEETLNETDVYNELIMLGLRTKKGVNISEVKGKFSEKVYKLFNNELYNNIKNNRVIEERGYAKISVESRLITDMIISDFFIV